MSPALLPSEARLERAMSSLSLGRVTNPPPSPWSLWRLPPGLEADWRLVDSYANQRSAIDEAGYTVPSPEAGTVFRVDRGGDTRWVGAIDRYGAMVPAGPLPTHRASGVTSWTDFWWGPAARASWMLKACERMEDARRLTLAVVACARHFAGRIDMPYEAYGRAIEVAERSCEAGATVGEIRAARTATIAPIRSLEEDGYPDASYLMLAAHMAISFAEERRAPIRDHAARKTAEVAATAWGLRAARGLRGQAYADALDRARGDADREMAATVRGYLWLGDAILATRRR